MEASKTIRRIEKIMRYYSLSTKEFSLKTGIQKSVVDNFKVSDYMVTLTMVQKICNAFPQINARWLLVGEGNFLIETKNELLGNNKLKINILIEDFKLPLKIERTNEEFYRKAGKCLKDKINAYKLEHPKIDIQRTLKLVGFYFAIESVRNEYINNSNKVESPINICQYRQAAFNFREKLNFYSDKYPYFEFMKLYSIVAYHFTVNYQHTISINE